MCGSSSALVLSENDITYADSRIIFEHQQRNLLGVVLISARNILCEKVWVEFSYEKCFGMYFFPFPSHTKNMTIDMYIALKAEGDDFFLA